VNASWNLRVERSGPTPLSDELALGSAHDQTGDEHRHRNRDQRDQGQGGGDPQHHRHDEADREQRGDELAHRLLQALGNVVDVVGDPAEQLTARLAIEVSERKSVQLVFDIGPQLVDRALNDVVQQVALKKREQGRPDVQGEHDQQNSANGREIDALARNDVNARQEIGDLVLSLGSGALDRLRFREAGR